MKQQRLSELQKQLVQVLGQSPYLSNETVEAVVTNAKLLDKEIEKIQKQVEKVDGYEKYQKEAQGCWQLFLETNKIHKRKLTPTEEKQWADRFNEFNKRERYKPIVEAMKAIENKESTIKLVKITDKSGIPPVFILNHPELF